MNTSSVRSQRNPLSRRAAVYATETTQQLITFRLRTEWFALPLEAVTRVIWLETLYGDPKRTGVCLTRYQNQELLVIDVGYRIFGEPPQQTSYTSEESPPRKYLIILQSTTQGLVGLPIDSQPIIQQIPASSFQPLPEAYLTQGNLHCISSNIVKRLDAPPLFLLETEQLIQYALNAISG